MSSDQTSPSPSRFDMSASSQSVVTDMPLPPPGPMFARFLMLAFECGIIKPETLLRTIPPRSILEALKDDKERIVGIYRQVMLMDESFAQKFAARIGLDRMIDDIAIAIDVDPEAADRLHKAAGLATPFFVEHVPLGDIYDAVMVTGWMLDDTAPHRVFAAQLCEALVEYQAFGPQHETERHIVKSIGLDVLFGDKVPAELRVRMAKAIYEGGKTFKDEMKPMYAYLFERFVKGVAFADLAKHLPVEVMARPFASYVDKIGVVRTSVEMPSEMPPPGVLAVVEAMSRPPVPKFPVPRPGDAPHLEVTSAADGDDSES